MSKIYKTDIYRAFYQWEKDIESGSRLELSDIERDQMSLHDRAIHLTERFIEYLRDIKNAEH